jgi:hypothetical protein
LDTNVLVAIISASGSVIVAAFTYLLSKRQQINAEWRTQKLSHYRELLASLSDLAVDGVDKEVANKRFSLAFNTIALVAPQSVIDALNKFHDEVKFSNVNRSDERHDQFLKELVLAIRADLNLSTKDDPQTFSFHLIGSAPKDNADKYSAKRRQS